MKRTEPEFVLSTMVGLRRTLLVAIAKRGYAQKDEVEEFQELSLEIERLQRVALVRKTKEAVKRRKEWLS